MQLQNEYSMMLLLRRRCGTVVILNVTGVNAVSFLPVVYAMFSLFLTALCGSGTWAPYGA